MPRLTGLARTTVAALMTGATVILATTVTTPPAAAGVKLITLPVRERVEIQLDHERVTLVEEERIVPLAAGVNDLVFKWTNTQIDRDSIQLRCLTDPERIRVISVTYPPGESALVWQVSAPEAGSARVRISYAVGQLGKSYAYRAVASHDESTLTLRQYVALHNSSPETFGASGMWTGFGERLERPIDARETRELLTAKFADVPVRKTYTADFARYGYLDAGKQQLRIPMHYVLANDETNRLGTFPLMPGKTRIFQDDGRGTTAFLGEDWMPFTARNDEAELYLGVAKDVVVKRTIERNENRRVFGTLGEQRVVVKYEIENFKDRPVTLDIAESLSALRNEVMGHLGRPVEWTLSGEGSLRDPDPEKTDADRVLFHVELPAAGDDQKAKKVTHELSVVIHNEW